jgi:hypothetical protein
MSDAPMKAKSLRSIVVAVILVFAAAVAVILVKDYNVEKDYVEVEATQMDVVDELDVTSDTSLMANKTARYEYTYEKTEYRSGRSCFFLKKEDIGNTYTIRVDPQNPSVIEDLYKKGVCIGIEVFLVVFWFFLQKFFSEEEE